LSERLYLTIPETHHWGQAPVVHYRGLLSYTQKRTTGA